MLILDLTLRLLETLLEFFLANFKSELWVISFDFRAFVSRAYSVV